MEIGWTELMVIGVVALVVIGPKDLPEMFRTLGRITAKARSMAREFSRAMEQAAKETGVSEVAADLKNVTSPRSMGLEAVKSAADKFEKWDPLKNAAKPTAPLPVRVPPGNMAVAAPAEAAPVAAAPAAPVEAAPVAAPGVAPGVGETVTSDLDKLGPATRALAEQKAQRQAIAREAAEKLRAVGTETAAPAAPAAKPRAKPPAKAAPKAEDAAPPAPKPRAKAAKPEAEGKED